MPRLIDDLHLTPTDPATYLATVAYTVPAGDKLVVRVPDRGVTGNHALRVDDVGELLQTHARVLEIGVTGGGTIVAAAETLKRRGTVAVWTGRAIGKWHPTDIVQRGLGGSETAAVRLAEQFARMGYATTLYGDFDGPGIAGDIVLKHFGQFDPSQPVDCLVGFRYAPLFDHRPTGARYTILWLEDLAPAERLTPQNALNIDRIVTVTNWHKEQVQRVHPWINPRHVTASRNGIMVDWFKQEPAPYRELRVVCSSSPDRGGDIVLECWPAIKRAVPDAELVLTYPRWFEQCADSQAPAHSHRERLRELVKQDGASRVDTGLGQQQLANLMRASLVWVNPGYFTPGRLKFEETSCISAMEAQAAGLVIVASNWGAVTETIQYGTLLDGDPGEEHGVWRQAFVDQVVRGLTDPVLQAAAQECGPAMVRDCGWDGPGEQLAAMFDPAPVAAAA